MTFINEYISQEDKIKYDLDKINSRYICSGISEQWTIDRAVGRNSEAYCAEWLPQLQAA